MDDMKAFFENASPMQINEYYAKQAQEAQPEVQPQQAEPQPEPTSVLEVLQATSPEPTPEPVIDEKQVQADQHYEEAKNLYNQGDYQGAIKELEKINKDEKWVVSILENSYQTKVQDVLLATLDRNDKLTIFLYNKEKA